MIWNNRWSYKYEVIIALALVYISELKIPSQKSQFPPKVMSDLGKQLKVIVSFAFYETLAGDLFPFECFDHIQHEAISHICSCDNYVYFYSLYFRPSLY